MTARGLKDPGEVEKASAAGGGKAQEQQRIPDPMLPEVDPSHPDAPLVDLWRQRNDLLWPIQLREIALDTNEESDAFCERLTELEVRIATTPATTIVGVGIKSRLLWEHGSHERKATPWVPIEAPGGSTVGEEYALFSLVSDAVRLAMAHSEADAELFKLCDAWQEVWHEGERLGDQSDEQAETRARDRCRGIERQITRTRARTAEGVVAKLRMVSVIWGDDPDDPEQLETTDQRVICSAVIDVGKLPERNGTA